MRRLLYKDGSSLDVVGETADHWILAEGPYLSKLLTQESGARLEEAGELPESEWFGGPERLQAQVYEFRVTSDGDDIELVLPVESEDRKEIPLTTGVLDYFPAALAEVARLSKAGNDKHNPGEPLHHARGKSTDHADCISRHLLDRGRIDPTDGISHTVKLAWRALALLQEELEAQGAPLARGARE